MEIDGFAVRHGVRRGFEDFDHVGGLRAGSPVRTVLHERFSHLPDPASPFCPFIRLFEERHRRIRLPEIGKLQRGVEFRKRLNE